MMNDYKRGYEDSLNKAIYIAKRVGFMSRSRESREDISSLIDLLESHKSGLLVDEND